MPVPQYHPSPRELDDLELLTSGALYPVTRFNEAGSPITLTLPPELADADAVDEPGTGLTYALVAAALVTAGSVWFAGDRLRSFTLRGDE